jgi:5-methylcytosine-specific restriction endonuclease McrA
VAARPFLGTVKPADSPSKEETMTFEEQRKQAKKWAEGYKQRQAIKAAEYRKAHFEDRRYYYQTHKSAAFARVAKRRAIKHGVTIGDIAEIRAVYRRARETENVECYLCGKLIPLGGRHVDHVIPLCKGGAHTGGNLGIAHATCNLKKGSKLPEEIGLLI